MREQYLMRLDDACPTMDHEKWGRLEVIFDKHGIRPMVGIVPDNQDITLICQDPEPGFWELVRSWQAKGWAIAMHGVEHRYVSEKGLQGMNPMWRRSEFAGVPLEEQKSKIRKGISALKEKEIDPHYFFAPSHTFDENTLLALREETDIRIISDTIANMPYFHKGFALVPQVCGRPRIMHVPGIWTFCLHPNTMKNADFELVDEFLKTHSRDFISWGGLDLTNLRGKNLFSRIMSFLFFGYRRIRGLK